MKLYTFSPAPNPMRVGYMLKYKGISLETVEINLKEKQQFNSEFKKINPNCTVPALVLDDNSVLTESIAICAYLENKYPQKPLFGNNSTEYAQVINWINKIYIEGLSAIAEILRNSNDFFKDSALPSGITITQLPELAERGKIRLDAFWRMLEQHLSQRSFIVGDSFTQADIDAYVVCQFANWVQETVPKQCKNIQRWLANTKTVLDTDQQ